QVGLANRGRSRIGQRGSGIDVGLVRKMRAGTAAALDLYAGAGRNELLAGFRRDGDAPLPLRGCARDTDGQAHPALRVPSSPILARISPRPDAPPRLPGAPARPPPVLPPAWRRGCRRPASRRAPPAAAAVRACPAR